MTTKIQQLQKIIRMIDGSLAVISLGCALYYIGTREWVPAVFWTIGAAISVFAYIWPPIEWVINRRYLK
jgi:hypothetical protein